MNFKFEQCTVVEPRLLEGKGAYVTNDLGIKAGSAIVTTGGDTEGDEGGIRLYYEGNIYGAENLRDYKERILVAAGRAMTAYPTTAFVYIPKKLYRELFTEVGQVVLLNKRMVVQLNDSSEQNGWASTTSTTQA